MADITSFVSNDKVNNNSDENNNEGGDHEQIGDQHEDLKEIHIRVKKRNGRKCITTLEGLNVISDDPILWKKLFRYFKKTLCCNGSLDEVEKTFLLSGDQREKIKKYLLEKKLCQENEIKIHGF